MPIQIIRNDITKVECDAIVNAANATLLGGGGVDGAIHRAAGRGLLLECMKLGGCKVGQAKITGAYKLPCRYVIHTVGPKWRGGGNGERALLESCYRESLRLAADNNCQSVAFPLISSGVYRYPKDEALRVAVDTIAAFLSQHEMLVYIVVFDKSSFKISEKLFFDIASYIDDRYAEAQYEPNRSERRRIVANSVSPLESCRFPCAMEDSAIGVPDSAPKLSVSHTGSFSLDEALKQIDETFSQTLLRKIDEKNMTDAQCYKKANIDRKLFSKIRSDVNYRPGKATAIAFAIALELSLAETKDLLMKAGFALSHSNKFDIIIEYFIVNGNYDVFQINEALFAFDQNLLGGNM